MDSRLALVSASGVRALTVFVLSTSLFLLIYNVGRRRMTVKNSRPRRDSAPDITNPSSLGGYFSHYRNKPIAHHRTPSLTVALESAVSTRICDTGLFHPIQLAGTSSDGPRDFVESSQLGRPGDDNSRGENLQFVSTGDQVATSTSPNLICERKFSLAGHEEYMIEHMRRRSQNENEPGHSSGDTLGSQRRRSSSSVLGDMSQLETPVGNMVYPRSSPETNDADTKRGA